MTLYNRGWKSNWMTYFPAAIAQIRNSAKFFSSASFEFILKAIESHTSSLDYESDKPTMLDWLCYDAQRRIRAPVKSRAGLDCQWSRQLSAFWTCCNLHVNHNDVFLRYDIRVLYAPRSVLNNVVFSEQSQGIQNVCHYLKSSCERQGPQIESS